MLGVETIAKIRRKHLGDKKSIRAIAREFGISRNTVHKPCPVLMERLKEIPRFTGAVYKVAGWVRACTTQGRGKYDRERAYGKPRKDIWRCPLRNAKSGRT